MKQQYSLPEYTLPSISIEDHLNDLNEFLFYLKKRGINYKATRLYRYAEYLRLHIQDSPEAHKVFHDIDNEEFNTPHDVALYVLREVHELMWILKGIKIYTPIGIEEKFRLITGGKDFAALDEKTISRNTQFELRIGSYFCQTKYSVDISSQTDIIATKNKLRFFIECKRVSSQNNLIKRIIEAQEQIKKRMPKSNSSFESYGIVAVDVTRVAFQHNGLTFAETPEHGQDVIQQKLIEIQNAIKDDPRLLNQDDILMIWLQIHIPNLVHHPTSFGTRISSLFFQNNSIQLKRKHRRAFETLKPTIEIGHKIDERATIEKLPEIKGSVTIPAGTTFKWNEPILENLLKTWCKDERYFGTIVLSAEVTKTDYEFYYEELTSLLPNIPKDLQSRLSNDINLARGVLMAMLLRQKDPYKF